jgi:HTH-type transcriptional regulator, sugar sensing transcriptional regulator
MTNPDQITIFENEPDTELSKYQSHLKTIQDELRIFGLTENQSRVFMFLGKYGAKTAPVVAKALKLPRTETYHLLSALQNLGIVLAQFAHPIKFDALPMNEAIQIIINRERLKITELDEKKEEICDKWGKIPMFAIEADESLTEKMQTLQGSNSITNKLISMAENCKKEFLIFGSPLDINKLNYANIFDKVRENNAELKIVISPIIDKLDLLSEIGKRNVRAINSETSNKCFVVIDNKEMLTFVRNANHPTNEIIAQWSDSDTMTETMRYFFNLSWDNAEKFY